MAKTGAVARPKRGEIYVVSFEPTVGAEIKKTRPAVIIQNDIANRWSPVTIVAAMTSKFADGRRYPTEVAVQAPEGGLRADSVIFGRHGPAGPASRCLEDRDHEGGRSRSMSTNDSMGHSDSG